MTTLHPPREILRDGDHCTAFVVLDDSGRANIHVLRPGLPPLSVLGVAVTKKRTDRPDTRDRA